MAENKETGKKVLIDYFENMFHISLDEEQLTELVHRLEDYEPVKTDPLASRRTEKEKLAIKGIEEQEKKNRLKKLEMFKYRFGLEDNSPVKELQDVAEKFKTTIYRVKQADVSMILEMQSIYLRQLYKDMPNKTGLGK